MDDNFECDGGLRVDPLAQLPESEPEPRVMTTGTPYVDKVPGATVVADLDEPATRTERTGLSGRVGGKHGCRRVDWRWS